MHYGEGSVLGIEAVADASYHEYGYFSKATINKGRIVIEDSGKIEILDASSATEAVSIEQSGSGSVTNIIKGNNANVSVESDLEDKVATV